MIMNTSISRCLKSDFKAFKKIGENLYILAWGKQDEVEYEFTLNEKTGKRESTKKVVETDWCTYESGLYRGVLTPYLLEINVFSGATRYPSISEVCDIYKGIGVSKDQQIVYLKEKLKEVILRYDNSSNVNEFYINNTALWLNREERGTLERRFKVEQKNGSTNTTLWRDGVAFPLTIEVATQILDSVELYAIKCYDKTQEHLANVSKLGSIEEIESYDYKVGYPEKMRF